MKFSHLNQQQNGHHKTRLQAHWDSGGCGMFGLTTIIALSAFQVNLASFVFGFI